MSGNKLVFSTLDESYHDTVRFGDNSEISIMGKGKVNIQANDFVTRTISDVLYILGLKQTY